eukprot:TRINITY_DN2277_c0_g7_i1.p1 TRINITY_DN2277_c0_g7~~TRINITY_DN2277_c0_g7_i1.p1  ORF type:complete len:309 (+),score=16.38 TRINITY_DN2277_c0_g7_i1:31-957(+)
MPSKRQTWKYVLDLELRKAGGVLHVEKLKGRMMRSYLSERHSTRSAHCLGLEALASIPDEYLSMVDSYVRLPPTDLEIVRARSKLQWHCQQFEGHGNKFMLIDRYATNLETWAGRLDAHSVDIMKHAVHVAAWLAFAAEQEDDLLSRIASLLVRMLVALEGVHPIPRLRLALHHAADRLNDLDECEWATNALLRVDSALGRLSTNGSFSQSNNVAHNQVGRVGNYQRTDLALVRQVLGHRQLPHGCRILFKAPYKTQPARWCGRVRGSESNQFSANLRRFTETEAIEHVYRCIVSWHEYQTASAPTAD